MKTYFNGCDKANVLIQHTYSMSVCFVSFCFVLFCLAYIYVLVSGEKLKVGISVKTPVCIHVVRGHYFFFYGFEAFQTKATNSFQPYTMHKVLEVYIFFNLCISTY